MAQLKVQQKKGVIGVKANQRETLRTLGLKRIGKAHRAVITDTLFEVAGSIDAHVPIAVHHCDLGLNEDTHGEPRISRSKCQKELTPKRTFELRRN